MGKKGDSFGTRLRALREMEGLSREELGKLAGIKPAALARLEDDKELPPVADVMRLARVLSVEPAVFMDGPAAPGRRRQARVTRTEDYAYEDLTPGEHEHHLMAFRVTIEGKRAHQKVGYRHEGEEFIYVLSGRLQIAVAGKTRTLGPGESLRFDSGQKHQLSNPGAEPAVLVVALYVP